MRLSRSTEADGSRRPPLVRQLFAASLTAVALTATGGLGVTALGGTAEAATATPMPGTAVSIPDTAYAVPANAVVVSPTGDDAAAGTLAAPFRTVVKAVSAVPAGGTVVLRGGDYREALGSINKPFTLQSFPHEQAWLKGSALVTGWTAAPSAVPGASVWKHGGWTNQFCRTCVNPQAVDPANPLAGWPDQVFVNGAPLTQVDSPAKVTAGTFNIDYTTQTITVGSDPTGRTVESSNRWNAMTVNSAAAGLTLRGIGIAQYAPNWNENQLGALVVAANNVTLENSAVVWNTGRGAQFNSPGGRIVGTRLNDNGYSGLGTNRAHGLVVSRNQIDGNNWRHFAVSGCGMYCTVAGYKAAHTANSTVTDNTVRNNVGTGYWCDLGCNGTTIVRNYVEGNTNKGIFYEVSTTGVIASNVLRRNTVGLELAGTDQTAIYNNTFDRNGTHLELYDDTRLSSSDAYSGGLGLSWNTTGNTVRNNVFAATTGGVAIDTNATSQVNAQQMLAGMDHNAYYRTSATAPLVHWCPTYGAGCPTYTSVASFAAASGWPTAGSLDTVGPTNPYFVNPDDGRYEMVAGSPVVNGGAPLPAAIASPVGSPVSPAAIGAVRWGIGVVWLMGDQAAPAPTPTPTPTTPVLVLDTIAPTIAGNVAAGGTLTKTVTLSATARDDVGVVRSELWLGATRSGSFTGAGPYAFDLDTTKIADGSTVTLTWKAFDAAGHVGTSAVTATVRNPDVVAPTATIVTPVATATTIGGASYSLTAKGSDDRGVARAELYLGSSKSASFTGPGPYAFAFRTTALANGASVHITWKVYDAAGNVGSATKTVTVSN